MELSLLLAKIIGLTLVIIGAALLSNRKNVDLLFSVYSNPGPVFLTGILETGLGLAMVFNHNIWTLDYRGIITFIGWMLLVRGIGRTFFPKQVIKRLQKFKKMQWIFTPLLVVIVIIGAYLAYSGFTG